jgi:hypothetical protein
VKTEGEAEGFATGNYFIILLHLPSSRFITYLCRPMTPNRSIGQYRLENALQYALIFQLFAVIFYLVYASLAPVEEPKHALWDERLFGAGVFGFLAGIIEESFLRRRTRKMPFAKALILQDPGLCSALIAISFPLAEAIYVLVRLSF